jgi:hypothetical protein
MQRKMQEEAEVVGKEVDEKIREADGEDDDESILEDVAINELIIRLKPTEDSLISGRDSPNSELIQKIIGIILFK